MFNKKYISMIFIFVVANLFGGFIANIFFVPKSTFAKEAKQDNKSVIAEEFVLVNKEGRHIARLGIGPDGSAAIQFFDETYTPRATLGILVDGTPALDLYDKDRKMLLELGLSPEKYLGLSIFDMENLFKHKSTRVWLGLTDDDFPTLAFIKKDGQVGVGIGQLPDGSSSIAFPEASGKGGALLWSKALSFQDDEGKITWSKP